MGFSAFGFSQYCHLNHEEFKNVFEDSQRPVMLMLNNSCVIKKYISFCMFIKRHRLGVQ